MRNEELLSRFLCKTRRLPRNTRGGRKSLGALWSRLLAAPFVQATTHDVDERAAEPKRKPRVDCCRIEFSSNRPMAVDVAGLPSARDLPDGPVPPPLRPPVATPRRSKLRPKPPADDDTDYWTRAELSAAKSAAKTAPLDNSCNTCTSRVESVARLNANFQLWLNEQHQLGERQRRAHSNAADFHAQLARLQHQRRLTHQLTLTAAQQQQLAAQWSMFARRPPSIHQTLHTRAMSTVEPMQQIVACSPPAVHAYVSGAPSCGVEQRTGFLQAQLNGAQNAHRILSWLGEKRAHHWSSPPPPPPPPSDVAKPCEKRWLLECDEERKLPTLASTTLNSTTSFIGSRTSSARMTLPIMDSALLAAAAANCHSPPVDIPDNACFGSYRRARRKPEIEAKFCTHIDAIESIASANHASTSRNAKDPQLFVKELNDAESAPISCPPSGQRTEQRRHKTVPSLHEIGTREKIETFLRSYNFASNNNNNYAGERLSPPEASYEPPIAVEDVDSVTFQPYYNLPMLKYEISLPISKTNDGSLLLRENSQFRRSSYSSSTRSRNNAANHDDKSPLRSQSTLSHQSAYDSSVRRPAPPVAQKPSYLRANSTLSCPLRTPQATIGNNQLRAKINAGVTLSKTKSLVVGANELLLLRNNIQMPNSQMNVELDSLELSKEAQTSDAFNSRSPTSDLKSGEMEALSSMSSSLASSDITTSNGKSQKTTATLSRHSGDENYEFDVRSLARKRSFDVYAKIDKASKKPTQVLCRDDNNTNHCNVERVVMSHRNKFSYCDAVYDEIDNLS